MQQHTVEYRLAYGQGKVIAHGLSAWRRALRIVACVGLTVLLAAATAAAAPPGAKIEYQPMTSDGLAAGYPFEAWVVFDVSSNPAIPGQALPAGASFRFTFPKAFTAQPGRHPEAVLLYGWPQKAAPIRFITGFDPQNPNTIMLTLMEAFPAGPPERPGLKAIHLRWGPDNPPQAGDYPVTIKISDAGEFSGTTVAVAHITPKSVPNVAAYNQLHEGRNEEWQHVKMGQTAPLPIDLLITLPDKARSFIALRPSAGGNLEILSDGAPIGTISRRGVPVTLKAEPFGPGFARLGIVRFQVTAGSQPGAASIDAQLQGGTRYTLQVIVER
jgi:hypothetical protein